MPHALPMILEDVVGFRPLGLEGLTVGALLAAHRLPESMFQPYLVRGETATPVPLFTPLRELPADADKLLIRAIRNTLFATVLPAPAVEATADPETAAGASSIQAAGAAGVGFWSIRPDASGLAQEARAIVGIEQAQRMVAEEVSAFEQQYGTAEAGCVFGLSGGGDSNALAFGLADCVPRDHLLAFTLVFGAVFSRDAAVRAAVLCQDLGIEHVVLEPDAIARLLGITTSLDALYADFCAVFGEEALHFFGTFLVLRTARVLAAQRGFVDLAFGYNREDVLAEALFMVMNGRRPLSFPTRRIGAHRVVMPVWRVPKLLLDACHPQFSLENYRERDPYTTRQRSLAFFLAHALDSSYPSFGLSLLTGLAEAFAEHWGELSHVEDIDVFVVAGQAGDAEIGQARDLLRRHFAGAHP